MPIACQANASGQDSRSGSRHEPLKQSTPGEPGKTPTGTKENRLTSHAARHLDRMFVATTTLPTLLRCRCLCALLLSLVAVCYAQDPTSAALNKPSGSVIYETRTVQGGTSTVTGSTTTASAAVPTQTDVAPIAYASQQVPFLLSLPDRDAHSGQWGGPTFTGCLNDETVNYADSHSRINVSAVYTQLDLDRSHGVNSFAVSDKQRATLRIVAVGTVGNESHAFASSADSNGAPVGLLSAAGATTRFLTFNVFENYTFLCDRIFPATNDMLNPHVNPPSCQYGPGTVAFGITVPLNSTYEAGTLWTQIRLTDPSSPARTLACIEVQASPYEPGQWYWRMIKWTPVSLFIAFFLLATVAALATAETSQRMAYKNRAREGGPPTLVRDKLRPMILSALAGREMVRSPALLRFVTPGCWDVLLHLQFLVALAMCHVEWPDFVYPFARQAAWSSLLGNVTIVEKAGQSHSLIATNASLPAGEIGAQMSNISSPLFMNSAQNNKLLNLGTASIGIERFAAAVGLGPASLYGTCLSIWLAIVAVVLIVSGFAWAIDAIFESKYERKRRQEEASGEIVLPSSPRQGIFESKSRSKASEFSSLLFLDEVDGKPDRSSRARLGHHLVAMHGNLIRCLVLFHLPITILSTYQFAHPGSHSIVSVALAALSFAAFSVAAPVYVVWRIACLSTERLYEDNETLLALGPVYHMYAPGSQLYFAVSFIHSLALGLVVGAGQDSGAVQAIVILVVEVFAALASSLWLPWGDGAMMGPLNFMTGVLRIITAVLLVLLTSMVGFSNQARGWLTYVILLLQGVFFAGAILVVLVKLIEALVRLIWRVRFDERLSGRTAGLGGAVRKVKRRKLKDGKAAPLQLRQVRPTVHSRNTSMGSASTMRLLDKGGPTPANEANRLSYLSNLDHGHGKRPPSGGSDLDYFGRVTPGSRQGAYSPPIPRSGRVVDDNLGAIMAAMPPVTPGADANGFVRLNGARATQGNPFAAGQGNRTSPGHSKPSTRPQSFSGHVGDWEVDRHRTAAPRQVPGGYESVNPMAAQDISSTQAAAQAARHSLAGLNAGEPKPGVSDGLLGGLKRKWRKSADVDDDDDDTDAWSDEGGTWNSRAAAQNRVPWTGAVKFSSAIQSLFGGKGTELRKGRAPVNTEDEENSELSPAPQKGFEVVRKTRPGGSAPVRPSHELLDEQQGHGRQDYGQQAPTQATARPTEREASDFYRTPSGSDDTHGRRSTSNMTPLDFYQGPLGMLGADLQRAPSSAGHTINEGGEERFWLPPINIEADGEGNQEGPGRLS